MIYTTTIEELGKFQGISVDIDIEADYQPGEPRTWTEPGCPPSVEFCGVHVTIMESWCSPQAQWMWRRSEHEDWFEVLDDIVAEHVEARWEDQYAEEMLEDASNEDY